MPPLISESAQNLVPIIPQNSPKFRMTPPPPPPPRINRNTLRSLVNFSSINIEGGGRQMVAGLSIK